MPETTHYLILGFTVFFTTLTLYSVSLVVRFKHAQRDIRNLTNLKD